MRRVLAGIVILSIFLFVVGGAHLYLSNRLVWEPAWPGPLRALLLAGIWGGLGSFVAHGLSRHHRGRAAMVVAWGAYLWVGVAFLLLTATAASDGLVWLLGAAGSEAASESGLARIRAALVVCVALPLAGFALRQGIAPPRVRRVEVSLARWPRALDGFRIVQISDVHIGPLLDRFFAAEVTARANALDADLVAVTGDLVDGSVERLASEVEPFRELKARHGVWFVTGNHDHYSGADDWVALVSDFGWHPLRNARVTLGPLRPGGDADAATSDAADEDAGFDLAGVDDHRGDMLSREGGEDLDAALGGRDPDRPVVLLAHDPSTFKKARRHGVDLQLSGHTHGGQIWPFGFAVRATVRWVAGLHRDGPSSIYVSCGTGFWGPPMRLGAPQEITELTLRRA